MPPSFRLLEGVSSLYTKGSRMDLGLGVEVVEKIKASLTVPEI
jgi:hypothetical protein